MNCEDSSIIKLKTFLNTSFDGPNTAVNIFNTILVDNAIKSAKFIIKNINPQCKSVIKGTKVIAAIKRT